MTATGPSLSLIGSSIYLDNYRVADVAPGVWATQLDNLESLLNCASIDAVTADDHEEALAEREREMQTQIDDLETKVTDLELKIDTLEGENDDLQNRCDAYETTGGVAEAFAELREDLERERRTNERLRELLRTAQAAATPKRRTKRA